MKEVFSPYFILAELASIISSCLGRRPRRDGDPGCLRHPERGRHHRRIAFSGHQTHSGGNF